MKKYILTLTLMACSYSANAQTLVGCKEYLSNCIGAVANPAVNPADNVPCKLMFNNCHKHLEDLNAIINSAGISDEAKQVLTNPVFYKTEE